MNWYEDEKNVAEAIGFVMKYSCIYGWTAFASNKTPCANYKEIDEEIPDGLREAIWDYIKNLKIEERRNLNKDFSLLLGERFFVRETAIVKILGRILSDGNPCENTDMIKFALQMQIQQRMELLETLRAC